MLEYLKIIDENYASVLSCIVAILSVLVTIVYVVFTHKQMKASQASVALMQKDLKQNQQPCIIPEIKEIKSAPAWSNGRRQMVVSFSLENIGNVPALAVYSVSYLILKNTSDVSSPKEIDMYSGPFYLSYTKSGEKVDAYLHYENREINAMFEDLSKTLNKNWERIKTDPTKHAYRGPSIVIRVFYKNVAGQWFESRLVREIGFAYDQITKEKTKNNLNEFTLPPRKLTNEIEFQLQLASPHLSPLYVTMVEEQTVNATLNHYKERWPALFVDS